MIEFILVLVITVILGYHAWYVHETNKQLREYMKGFMAKDLQDYVVAKKIEAEPKEEIKEADLLLASEMTENDFTKMITNLTKEETNG